MGDASLEENGYTQCAALSAETNSDEILFFFLIDAVVLCTVPSLEHV